MPRIIPAILVQNENDFRMQVSLAAMFAPMIQIDVLDGTMLPERAWNNAKAAAHLSIPFEAHLMVNDPELKVPAWIKAGAERVIIHAEAKGKLGFSLETIRHANRLAGIAINPETDLAVLKEFASFVDHFQIMGVHPGAQGREFVAETIDRVRAVKRTYPHITVGVDGGVTDAKHLVHELSAVGTDDLVVGSAIWKAENPTEEYKRLVEDAKI